MSLFHVIKYPLSCPPTEEQLAALPFELRYKYSVDIHSNKQEDGTYLWDSVDLHKRLISYVLAYEEDAEHNERLKEIEELYDTVYGKKPV